MLTDDLIIRLHSAILRAKAEGLEGTAAAMEELLRTQGHWDTRMIIDDWHDSYDSEKCAPIGEVIYSKHNVRRKRA